MRATLWVWVSLSLVACAGNVDDPDYSGRPSPATAQDGDGGTGNGASGGSGDGTGANGGAGNGGGQLPADDPADPCGDGSEPLAEGLQISEIAFFQTVKVPVFDGSSWISQRVAPVVQGKEALVRVYVQPEPSFNRRTVRGVLTLDNGGTPKRLTVDLTPNGASSDGTLGSTFNFDVPGEDISASTQISVALIETTCASAKPNASAARYPASGLERLNAQRIGTLRVTLVPVQLSSGPTPDTSQAQLDKIRDYLLAFYPVSEVELTVRATYNSARNLNSGFGWSQLLNDLSSLRQQDRPANDVYYYGLVTPAATLEQYCGNGCTLGIANQAPGNWPGAQVGLGGGWVDERAYETAVHEIGHTHGLGHAPCVPPFAQIQGVDQSFPNSDGDTDTWGWDFRKRALRTPSDKDIMGYCSPNWISAYHYNSLAERSLDVNNRARLPRARTGVRFRSLIVGGEGQAQWGRAVADDVPLEASEPAQLLDATGQVVAEIDVLRVSLSDSDDAFVYLPESATGFHAIALRGRIVHAADIAPAD